MTQIAVKDPNSATNFQESVRLPRPPVELEATLGAEPVPPVTYTPDKEQTVAIGSQIAEFAADVPANIRPQVSNAFLLGHLAANREIQDSGGGKSQWYARYVDVLANIGWLVESDMESVREISGSNAEVHKEIIPVLTAILGPAVAATTIVVTVLKGLADMDKDSQWITLFERESQRASANQFQISYASVDEGGNPRISLACFELDAKRSLTQVLFFKVSSTEANLRHFSAELGINSAVFNQVQGIVEERIGKYVSSFVADIKI